MAAEPEYIDGPERRVNPLLIVLLVVVALAALFFLVIRPLFFSEEEAALPPAVDTPPATTEPAPEDTPTPASPPEETFEVFESKDPFRPLVVAAAPGAPTDGTTAPTDGTSAGATDGVAGAPAPTGGRRVALLDVLTEDGTVKAQVRVGSTVYTVAEGEVFADNFKLVSISGDCGTFLHGDDKFTLCVGEEVIK